MTEEEKKKQQQQQGQTGAAANDETKPDNSTGAVIESNAESSTENKTEEPAWKTEAQQLRSRAAEYRKQSQSPIEDDTKGQLRPWDEFMSSRIYKSQKTPEQIAQEEKRERTARRLAALSDGLVALSNVTGAMFGATPVKQTSTMSAAHSKAVKEAAERRRLNERQYEIARQAAITAQQKQDADNAKRRESQAKARRQAGKDADTLEYRAAQLERQGGNADRTYELAKEKAKTAQSNADRSYGLAKQRLALAQKKEGRLASGSGSSKGGASNKKTYTPEHTRAAWDEWWRYTDDQRDEWRRKFGNRSSKTKDDDNFVSAVKQMHDSWKGTRTSKSKVKVKGSKKGGGYTGKFK